jgi:hypothetical protein
VRLTNWNEVGAYCLAVAITFVAVFILTPMVISPFYAWVLQTQGGNLWALAVNVISALTWLVTLLLFLFLRVQLDGIPAIVTAYDAERPVTTFWAEIAAYVIVSIIVQIILTVLSPLMISGFYSSLREGGHTNLLPVAIITVRAATALAFFAMFVLLRGLILSKRAE